MRDFDNLVVNPEIISRNKFFDEMPKTMKRIGILGVHQICPLLKPPKVLGAQFTAIPPNIQPLGYCPAEPLIISVKTTSNKMITG